MQNPSDKRPPLTTPPRFAGSVLPLVEWLEGRQFFSVAAAAAATYPGGVLAAVVPWAAPADGSGDSGTGASSGRRQLLVVAEPGRTAPRVTGLTIVNAADGSDLGPLVDGLDLTLPPGASPISIRADAAG